MLYKMLEANNGLPEIAKVTFANTGKEMPETLDFLLIAREYSPDFKIFFIH